ncbi:MAG: MaoC family dehydratase [Bacteroidales bacterium]|nr:MaoC family dehydratase [Bacteroidales bacterium]
MEKVVVNSYDEFAQLLGKQIGVSDYVEMNQDRINQFADATLDHQWIHVDPARAAVESPYGCTIVHGYLTLSMLPFLWNQIIEVNNLKMMVNYGMDKMKVGQRIRLAVWMESITNLRGTIKTEIKFQIQTEGERKPAVDGIATFLYYFNA